ncbi:hypothetical protein TcCL_NonESM08753 [Trypanosoma cruzi]|nr:hypothetical protein TcCL_NonESM08753 [Trypanosoma cruzi]
MASEPHGVPVALKGGTDPLLQLRYLRNRWAVKTLIASRNHLRIVNERAFIIFAFRRVFYQVPFLTVFFLFLFLGVLGLRNSPINVRFNYSAFSVLELRIFLGSNGRFLSLFMLYWP